MIKKIIEEIVAINWQEELEDKSVEDAIQWLSVYTGKGYLMGRDYYGYDGGSYGNFITQREETDEEYSARLVEEQAKADAKEAEQVRQAYLLQNKINILKGQDLALSTYLEKHKDNPRIGDLENLFMALAQANMSGATGAFVQQLQDCMTALENN